MPTYEYRCKECGHELEAVQAFTDDPLTECPSCGGRLRKKFGAPSIAFKGSGFYKNDSRPSSSSSSSSSTSGSDGAGADKAGAGSTTSSSGGSSSSSDKAASGGSTGSSSAPAKATTTA